MANEVCAQIAIKYSMQSPFFHNFLFILLCHLCVVDLYCIRYTRNPYDAREYAAKELFWEKSVPESFQC